MAVVSVSFLGDCESCFIEYFLLLPPNYGNYTGRTFNLVASTHHDSCFFNKIKVEDNGYSFLCSSINNSGAHVIEPENNGCNLKDLAGKLVNSNLSCWCDNL